jgi:AraC-like DNA-binding protein
MAEATQSQQLSPAAPADFEIVQHSPSALLAGLVSAMVGYREKLPGHVRQVEAASLIVPLVISFGDPFAIGLGRTPGDNDRYGSFAAGLFAGPVVIDSFGTASCLQINFTPLGARRFFGMPMSEIADRMVGLDDVLGQDGMALREQLANQPDWNRRFDLAEAFVVRKLASTNAPSREIEWAFDHILNRCGRVKIASIARSIGWSRKHLGQRFAQDIGLGPKTVARIVRFNRALTLSRAGENGGWAGIAAECGYSDQAHLVREFGELAGASPGAWSANGGWAAAG